MSSLVVFRALWIEHGRHRNPLRGACQPGQHFDGCLNHSDESSPLSVPTITGGYARTHLGGLLASKPLRKPDWNPGAKIFLVPASDRARYSQKPWMCHHTRNRQGELPPISMTGDLFHQPCLVPWRTLLTATDNGWLLGTDTTWRQRPVFLPASDWRYYTTPTSGYHGKTLNLPSFAYVCHQTSKSENTHASSCCWVQVAVSHQFHGAP